MRPPVACSSKDVKFTTRPDFDVAEAGQVFEQGFSVHDRFVDDFHTLEISRS